VPPGLDSQLLFLFGLAGLVLSPGGQWLGSLARARLARTGSQPILVTVFASGLWFLDQSKCGVSSCGYQR